MDDSRRKYGAMAFLPLVVFLVIYVGCGITFTLMGAESPFGMFPRHVAILVGIGVALLLAPEIKISEKLDVFAGHGQFRRHDDDPDLFDGGRLPGSGRLPWGERNR